MRQSTSTPRRFMTTATSFSFPTTARPPGSIMRDPATRPEQGLPPSPCARLCPRHLSCSCSVRSASSCHQEPPSPSTARRASSTASSSPPRSATCTPSPSAMRIRSRRPSSRPSPLPPAPPRPPCLPPPCSQALQAESEQYFSNLNEAQSRPETKYHFFWRAATPSHPHPPSRAPRVLCRPDHPRPSRPLAGT